MSKQLILDSLIGQAISAGMRINWVSEGTKDKAALAVLNGITGLINNGTLKVLATYTEAEDMTAVPVDLVALVSSLNGKGTYEVPKCEDDQYHVFTGTIFPRWVNKGHSEDSLAGMFGGAETANKAGGLY
jgi:hypothetical protein